MNEEISNYILFIGPKYKNHRGGIGAVIAEHKMLLNNSKFYCSFKVESKFKSVLYSIIKMGLYPLYLLLNLNIKIVHIHSASRGSFYRKYYYFFVSKYVFRKKVIYHVHGGEFHIFLKEVSPKIKKRIHEIMYKSDKVVVLSDWWFNYLTNQFPGIRLTRVYNSVSPQEMTKIHDNRENTSFLFLGLISENKGCYDLIEVAKKLVKQDFVFTINIGGNGESEKLKTLIIENDLNGYINFLGWVSGEAKREQLLHNDVYVLPSKNEGLPVSILEAMSFGLPIISTKVGGIPEMIEDSKSGFIIEPSDLVTLEKKMIYFIENKERIKDMGNRSKEIITQKFSSQIIKELLLGLYNGLLNEGKK